MHSKKGFCLTEFMVVAGIVAILSSLLLAAIGRAKKRVLNSVCQSNLKQWHLAHQLYASDNQDFLAPEGNPNPIPDRPSAGWYTVLPATLGVPSYFDTTWRTNGQESLPSHLFLCPANKRKSNGRNLFHYSVNEGVDGTGLEDRPIRLASIMEPSRLVWMFDSKNLPAVGRASFLHGELHTKGGQLVTIAGNVGALKFQKKKTKSKVDDEQEYLWTSGFR